MPKRKEDRDEDLLAMTKRKSSKFCPHCGRRIHFYAFEKRIDNVVIGAENMFLKTKRVNMITD